MQKFFTLSALLLLLSCTQDGAAQSKIDAAHTEAMLKIDSSVQLVDLRSPGELQETGRIAGAKTINFSAPEFQTQIAQLDRDKPVILYCAAGGRSARAAAQLTKMGFKNVYNYAGGMNDWLAKGKKTVP